VTDRALTSTQLDLRTVTAAEIPLRRTFTAAELASAGEELTLSGDVRFEGVLQKRDQRFRLKGRVEATAELACARCTEPFAWPIEAEVDLTYVPQPSATAKPVDPDIELTGEDLTTAYYQDHVLDLGEMLREQFHLAMPMRPLHSEACKGLCPHCGTNLNTATCDCEVRWQDPRLAVLQSLLRSPEDKR
jgi:uncharacterized protein